MYLLFMSASGASCGFLEGYSMSSVVFVKEINHMIL